MKKIFLFLAIVSAFSLASCKKDRTCTCTTTSTSNGTSVTTTDDIIVFNKSMKSDARENCLSTTTTSSNGDKEVRTCTLK